jgi:integrase
MPTKHLTDLFCERVKPPRGGRDEYFDAAFPGLGFRVTQHGAKSWFLFWRRSGRRHRYTIGTYPQIKPAQARREASAALERARADDKVDLTKEKHFRRYTLAPESATFAATVRDYLELHGEKNLAPRTYAETKRVLESDDLAAWRRQALSEIERRDVIDAIDRIAKRAEVQANRTLGRLQAFFNWAIEKDRLQASPAAGIRPPTREAARDRVLDDDELRWLWSACDEIGWPFGPLHRLLLLTAQRRDEVAGMCWVELELDEARWVIPKEKAKNRRAHEVQLPGTAVEILRSVPRIGRGFVFTTNDETKVSGFSRAKRRLDAAMLAAKREDIGGRKVEPIAPWRVHDLRRTAATGMARLGFPPHVVDKVLNHASGTIRGVAAIYNRFEYLDERRAALEAWGRYVDSLVTPAPANVVAFRK